MATPVYVRVQGCVQGGSLPPGWSSPATFSARIYYKTADVERRGADWWFGIWGDRYVPGSPVYRVEFEIGRTGFTDFDLDSPAQVIAAAGDLRRYATSAWLAYRLPRTDATRARWPVAAEWRQVQSAELSHKLLGLERIRAGHHKILLTAEEPRHR